MPQHTHPTHVSNCLYTQAPKSTTLPPLTLCDAVRCYKGPSHQAPATLHHHSPDTSSKCLYTQAPTSIYSSSRTVTVMLGLCSHQCRW